MTGTGTLEGLVNFRDLGGWRVDSGGVTRTGRLFRSDSIATTSDSDVAYLRDTLRIVTAVDLRDAPEVAEFGRGGLGSAPGVTHVEVPIGDVPAADTRHTYYFEVLRRHGPRLADLVRTLSAPRTLPAVVYCHIGCDRTGVVAAMLLSLAGVARDDVCAEYALSTRASTAIRDRSRARRRALGLSIKDDAYYAAWEPHPDVMAATLDLVDAEWGSMHGWAAAAGLSAPEVDALRAALTA